MGVGHVVLEPLATPVGLVVCACVVPVRGQSAKNTERRSNALLSRVTVVPRLAPSRQARSIAALLGPLPPTIAARLRKMNYMPPPPRGAPTRTLEACLDGSTGKTEVIFSLFMYAGVGGPTRPSTGVLFPKIDNSTKKPAVT